MILDLKKKYSVKNVNNTPSTYIEISIQMPYKQKSSNITNNSTHCITQENKKATTTETTSTTPAKSKINKYSKSQKDEQRYGQKLARAKKSQNKKKNDRRAKRARKITTLLPGSNQAPSGS